MTKLPTPSQSRLASVFYHLDQYPTERNSKASICTLKAMHRALSRGLLMTLTTLFFSASLSGCGGKVITKDNSIVSEAATARAKMIHRDIIRVNEIARKISIESVDLCKHRMPLLDFAAFALATEGVNNEETQAIVRTTGLDSYTRVIQSWNPQIPNGAKIEKISGRSIDPSNYGTEYHRWMTDYAANSDSVEVVINGVKRKYSEPQVCALQVLYQLGPVIFRVTNANTASRFVARIGAPVNPEDFNRSDDIIAAQIAIQLSNGAGGGWDAAWTAGHIGGVASLVPYFGPLFDVATMVVMTSLVDPIAIDLTAVRMIKKSGYDPMQFVSYWDKYGGKDWTAERRENWIKASSL
jgi:hypothetical protein